MGFPCRGTKQYISNGHPKARRFSRKRTLHGGAGWAEDRRTVIAIKPPADTPARPRSSTASSRAEKAASSRAAVSGATAAPGSVRKKAAAAGPKTRAKRAVVAPDLLEQSLAIITASLDDDKAENIVVIDLAGRASFADRMVIATGLADRQIAAMAQHIERKLRDIGIKRVLVEGANGSDWVLLDTGDIVVHLFKPESRAMYGLEKMWGAELDDSNEDSVTRL